MPFKYLHLIAATWVPQKLILGESDTVGILENSLRWGKQGPVEEGPVEGKGIIEGGQRDMASHKGTSGSPASSSNTTVLTVTLLQGMRERGLHTLASARPWPPPGEMTGHRCFSALSVAG